MMDVPPAPAEDSARPAEDSVMPAEGSPVPAKDSPVPAEDAIRAQLRKVPEPCGLLMRAPLDICEMGLVDEISCSGGRVRVVLVLTDPSCVHFGGMRRYITDVLLELPGVDAVEVAISTTTLWTPDRREMVNREARA
jgi:metal-sulfur cluster biosynthetic enzyme